MVVVEETRFHTNSDAMLEILRKLAFPFALVAGLAALLPKGFRDWGYDKVSSNRCGRAVACSKWCSVFAGTDTAGVLQVPGGPCAALLCGYADSLQVLMCLICLQIFGKTDMCRNTDQRYQERFVS